MTDLYSDDDTVYDSDYSDDDYINTDLDDDAQSVNDHEMGTTTNKLKSSAGKSHQSSQPQKTKIVEQPINEIMREYSPNRCYQSSAQVPSFIKDINRLELPSEVINKASELYYENGMPRNRKDCRRKMMAHFLISAAYEVNINISPKEIYKMCGLKGIVQGNNKFPTPLCIIQYPENYIDDQCLILQLDDDDIDKIKVMLNDLTKYKYYKDDSPAVVSLCVIFLYLARAKEKFNRNKLSEKIIKRSYNSISSLYKKIGKDYNDILKRKSNELANRK